MKVNGGTAGSYPIILNLNLHTSKGMLYMKNRFTILGAALILGLSYVAGCLLISNDRTTGWEQASVSQSTVHPLLTLAETAELLRISKDQVINIIKAENAVLSNNGPFEGMMLPYIKVDDKFLFNVLEIQNWVQQATLEQRVYMGTKITNR